MAIYISNPEQFIKTPNTTLASLAQQDTAYSVNEYLADRGYAEQAATGSEGLNKWLMALLVLSVGLFAGAITGLALLFEYFGGCSNSDTFNSLALILIVGFTICQLFVLPEDSSTSGQTSQANSLLTSAIVASYVVYLTFVSDSANPNEKCNPMYSQRENLLSVVLGISFTFITLCSTVYFASDSMTSLVGKRQSNGGVTTQRDLETVLTEGAEKETDERPSSSGGKQRASLSRMLSNSDVETSAAATSSNACKFNLVMVLISCYWCVVLTNWGNPGGGASSASPTAGNLAMWMNISASWICCFLYGWTIVAPKLFPDRDFS